MAATGVFLANAVEAPVCLSTRHCTPLTVGRFIMLLNHYSNVAVSFFFLLESLFTLEAESIVPFFVCCLILCG